MAIKNKENLKTTSVRQRRYVGRDFDSLRSMLLDYARQYYPDRMNDFSDSSLGGMLLDLSAYVGDNLSFYLDHQYGELDPQTSVETENLQRHINSAGVTITGASPAIVSATVYILVPALVVNGILGPNPDALPIVQSKSIFSSQNGTRFILVENIDFRKKKVDGSYVANITVAARSASGQPQSYVMSARGLCVSGEETSDTFQLGSFRPFRKISLSNTNVSEIISAIDGIGNTYYNVKNLTDDVVYTNVLNTALDNEIVPDSLKIISAPYRFTSEVDLSSRSTTLTLGGGDANILDQDDVIPDPSDFAISFPYQTTFSRIQLNPSQLLQTKTLGVAASDTTLTVTYRYGGGLSHNIPPQTLTNIESLRMIFPNDPIASIASAVRSSAEVNNEVRASGGEDAPSIDDLKQYIPAAKNSQERIVSREDLLARIYTMPANFGRVFRASVRSNTNNPQATQLYIVSRNQNGNLVTSSDTLKQNIVKYLRTYRMISDAIDILDARIINLRFTFDVVVDPTLNKNAVLQKVLIKLSDSLNVKNFNIDQPIVMSDLRNVIFSTNGIVSVDQLKFESVTTSNDSHIYSDIQFDVSGNTTKGILFPPSGGIFEIKYADTDIIGRAI